MSIEGIKSTADVTLPYKSSLKYTQILEIGTGWAKKRWSCFDPLHLINSLLQNS